MNRPLIVGIVVALLIVGAVAVGWFYYQANPDEWDSFISEMSGDTSTNSAPKPVKRASSSGDGLQASGAIEVDDIIISTLAGGKILDIFADEGQSVSEGDLLLVLDDRPLQAQRLSILANLDQTEAALEMVQLQLDMALAGPRSEEIAIAEGVVQTAAAQVDFAKAGKNAVLESITIGEGPSTATDHDLEAAEAQVDMAEGQLAQAQAQLVLVSMGATKHDRDILEAQVRQAEAARDAANAALQAIDIEIENASIHAPIDGVILQRLVNPGEITTPGGTLFMLADLDDLTLTVYIPEAELGEVRLGQSAQIQVDAYEDFFDGKVSHIASAAEFTPRNVQTQEERVHMVFAVKIRLDNHEDLLRPGMPADATFGE
jgi:HlyD family secretion protein